MIVRRLKGACMVVTIMVVDVLKTKLPATITIIFYFHELITTYRVTHHVVLKVVLTSKQEFRFIIH